MALDGTIAQPARPHDRFPCLDGVRAFAALTVVVYHAVFFNTFFRTPGGSYLANLNAGVFVFFVASGFLLYRPFAAAHLRNDADVDVRGYAVRRFARLYPAYWLVLAFFTFVVPRANIYGLHGFVLHTTLTQTYVHINPFVDGLPPAWSLVVEVSFYCFLPIYALCVGAAARGRSVLTVELAGLATLFVGGIVAISAIANGYASPWILVLPQYLAMFSLGMLLAVLVSVPWRAPAAARLDRIGRDAWVWWALALAVFVAMPTVVRLAPLAPRSSLQVVGEKLCQMAFGFCIVVPVVLGHQHRGVIRRILRSRVAAYLGLVSYGIYLWHWFLLRIVADWFDWPLYNGNWLVVLVAGLPIVVFAASVSWFGLERPIQRLAHRVAPGARPRRVPITRDPHALHDA